MYGWGRDDGGAAPAMQQQGQWGLEETKELIRIRADAERGSASPARKSKALWEAVSAELLLRGFARTPDQCKCKWKNLLNRYKGKETSDQSNGREFPFFDELHALFAERALKMHQSLQEANTVSPCQLGKKAASKKKKIPNSGRSEESSSEDKEKDENEDYLLSSEEEAPKKSKIDNNNGNKRRKKGNKSVGELVEELVRREAVWEKRWAEMVERRERGRAAFEDEWRARALREERERLEAEQAWREREEARREREEGRAERSDALLTSLLNSLIHDGHHH